MCGFYLILVSGRSSAYGDNIPEGTTTGARSETSSVGVPSSSLPPEADAGMLTLNKFQWILVAICEANYTSKLVGFRSELFLKKLLIVGLWYFSLRVLLHLIYLKTH